MPAMKSSSLKLIGFMAMKALKCHGDAKKPNFWWTANCHGSNKFHEYFSDAMKLRNKAGHCR